MVNHRLPICQGGTVVNFNCRHCRDLDKSRKLPKIQIQGPILPPGSWPSNPTNGQTNNGNGQPVPARQGAVINLGRFTFLVGMNPITQVSGFLGKRKVPYKGFVFLGGKTQKPIAILDCPETENAAYLFDASVQGWEAAAMMEKHRLRQNPPPEFLGKIVHSHGWEKRIRDRIANF